MQEPYQSVAAEAFVESDARRERLMRLLGEPSELVGLVLRGHLVLEELLFAACAAHCQERDHLKSARMRFPQLVFLLRALEKIPAAPPTYWDALLQFNSLRNALAHRLEPADIEQRIKQIRQQLGSLPPLADPTPPVEEELRQVVHFLVGGFEVVAVWQQAVELLVTHQLLSGSKEGAA